MDNKMRLLIGYDGSECANAALDDLQYAGLPQEAEVVILSVTETWSLQPSGSAMLGPGIAEGASSEKDQLQNLTPQAEENLRSHFPVWDVRSEVKPGSPATEILRKADEWKPDLIIVGSHGRSALGRLVFGSVSQRIVTEAYCSVRIGRSLAKRGSGPPRILIGVDGSSFSRNAVHAISMRPWPTGTEALLVTSIGSSELMDVTIEPRIMTPDELDKTSKVAGLIQHELESKLKEAGITVSSIIREGDPKRTLINESELWKADCIFVGSRGLGPLKRLLLGSVSTVIAARSHCSVEVVREQK
jgi:nucleotide-binding universal stress UspA family protein